MPSDTFAAGIEETDPGFLIDLASRIFAKCTPAMGFDQGDSDRLCRIAEALTPTASEATAIGAGEVSPSYVYTKPERCPTCGDTSPLAECPDCNDYPKRKVASDTAPEVREADLTASPKVASDTAPGVYPSLELCVLFSEDGQHIRKWSRLPFDGGTCFYSHPAALAASPTASDTDTAIPAGVSADHRAHHVFDRWDKPPHAPAYWFHLPSWVQEYATACVAATEQRLAAASPKPDTDTAIPGGES